MTDSLGSEVGFRTLRALWRNHGHTYSVRPVAKDHCYAEMGQTIGSHLSLVAGRTRSHKELLQFLHTVQLHVDLDISETNTSLTARNTCMEVGCMGYRISSYYLYRSLASHGMCTCTSALLNRSAKCSLTSCVGGRLPMPSCPSSPLSLSLGLHVLEPRHDHGDGSQHADTGNNPSKNLNDLDLVTESQSALDLALKLRDAANDACVLAFNIAPHLVDENTGDDPKDGRDDEEDLKSH